MSTTTTARSPLTIVEKLEQLGHETLTAIEHAAVQAVGWAAKEEASLQTLLKDNTFVRMVWDMGVASANAHGVPVTSIENIGEEIETAARQFIASLTAPPPAAPVIPLASSSTE